MQEFLTFIVDNALAGRGEDIRARTVAMDVYHRPPDNEDLASNVVRVNAGALRRLLTRYYDGAGSGDEVIIDVP